MEQVRTLLDLAHGSERLILRFVRHMWSHESYSRFARLTFQMLRRTFCTHFCARGTLKDAQQQLRHTNPAMTMRYFQVVPESLRSAVEELDQAVMEPMPAKPSRKRRQPVPIADQA